MGVKLTDAQKKRRADKKKETLKRQKERKDGTSGGGESGQQHQRRELIESSVPVSAGEQSREEHAAYEEEAEIEEFVVPELPFNQDDSRFDDFKKVFDTLNVVGDAGEADEEGKKGKQAKSKAVLRQGGNRSLG